MVSPASAGTLRAPRRRVSQSCTATAAKNIEGAAIAANHSCTAMSPPATPSHDAPPLSWCAIRNAAANGNRRTARSVRTHAQLSGIRVSTSCVADLGVGVAEPLKIDVFFDYLCPFVYRASVLLDAVQRSGRRDIEVRWRYFSLTQVNSKDDGWKVWSAYVRLAEEVAGDESLEVFERLVAVAASEPRILEIKRPRKPN